MPNFDKQLKPNKMKWKQKMSELGLTEETISHGLRAKIKDYYVIQKGIDKIKSDLQEGRINQDDIEDFENDLEELQKDLEDYDETVVKALIFFDKNKEKYANMQKNLKPNRGKKAEASNQNSTPTPTPTQTKKEELPYTPTEEVKEEKKGSGLGWLLFGLAAAVVTFGAVNIMKNRD